MIIDNAATISRCVTTSIDGDNGNRYWILRRRRSGRGRAGELHACNNAYVRWEKGSIEEDEYRKSLNVIWCFCLYKRRKSPSVTNTTWLCPPVVSAKPSLFSNESITVRFSLLALARSVRMTRRRYRDPIIHSNYFPHWNSIFAPLTPVCISAHRHNFQETRTRLVIMPVNLLLLLNLNFTQF